MSPRQRAFAAAIIEQTEGLILICRPRALDSARRAWVFPRTEVRPGETPEAAVRRATREGLGLDVEISVGQPPVIEEVEGQPAIVRYYVCHVASGQAKTLAYDECRWVLPGQLCEYEFEPGAQKVVQWYTA